MITSLLARALTMSTPLIIGSLSEVYAERAGMMNTAIEGIFLMGAWGGFVGAYLSGSILLGILTAILCGLLTALIYGFITISLKQHQVVTGTALNIFALGFVAFFQRVLFGVPTSPLKITPLSPIRIPLLGQIPFLGDILFNQNLITYFAFLIVAVSIYILYRTSWGLTVRSTGENPEAVDVAGISVNKVRYVVILLAGVFGGIAGSFYSLGFLGMFTTNIIGGRGWIAFAICFLGNWTPKGALLGSLVFGLTEAVGIYMQTQGSSSIFPNELFIALPYILTIVLTVARKTYNVPAKLGVPYNKEG